MPDTVFELVECLVVFFNGTTTDRCEEVSNPLGDHEGDHDTEAKRDVACALHNNDCQWDCCA